MTKTKKVEHNQKNCPTGKSLLIFRNRVKPKNRKESKIFLFSPTPNHRYITCIPFLSEGRIMIVTNVGRGAVDAGSADNERRKSVRRSRVVLTPRCWRQVLEKQASRG